METAFGVYGGAMTWKREEKKKNAYGRLENVCWKCKKYIDGCSWSRDFEPVEGWEAVPDTVKAGVKNPRCDTYKIYSCPEFEKGEAEEPKVVNHDAYYNLLGAIARRAVNDLKRKDSLDRETAKWFLNDSYLIRKKCKELGLWED